MYKLYCFFQEYLWIFLLSLPTRGAWIEISMSISVTTLCSVAPHTGSVDWNQDYMDLLEYQCGRSPHGERGLKSLWCGGLRITLDVAPHTGSVDWNFLPFAINLLLCCRSPHGERGLKFPTPRRLSASAGRSPHGERGLKWQYNQEQKQAYKSLPTRGAWIEILWCSSLHFRY